MYLTLYNAKIYNSISIVILIYIFLLFYWIRKLNSKDHNIAIANILTCILTPILILFFIMPLGMDFYPIGDNFKPITSYQYNHFCKVSVIGVILASCVCNFGYITYYFSIIKEKTIELNRISKIHFLLFPTSIIYIFICLWGINKCDKK